MLASKANEKLTISWISQTYERAHTPTHPLCLESLFHLQTRAFGTQGDAYFQLLRTLPTKYPALMNALASFVFSAARIPGGVDGLLDSLEVCTCDRSIPIIEKMHLSRPGGEQCCDPLPGMSASDQLKFQFATWVFIMLYHNIAECSGAKGLEKLRDPNALRPKDKGYSAMGRWFADQPALAIESLVAWYHRFQLVWTLRILMTLKTEPPRNEKPLNTYGCFPPSLIRLVDTVLDRIDLSMGIITGRVPTPFRPPGPRKGRLGQSSEGGIGDADDADDAVFCAQFVQMILCACADGRPEELPLEDICTAYKHLKRVADTLIANWYPDFMRMSGDPEEIRLGNRQGRS